MADDFKVQPGLYIDPDLPQWALIDSGRLRQVLLNVLSNAIKFSAFDLISRCPEVYLHIEHIHGTHLQVTLEDNGIGMPTSVTDNLFKPFMQGETSTTRRVDGTGLGLAITSNLLHLMNGDIAIKSAAGVGTTVAKNLETVEKTNTLTSLANQKVVWLTDDSFLPPRHFQFFLPNHMPNFTGTKLIKISRGPGCQPPRTQPLSWSLIIVTFPKAGVMCCNRSAKSQNLYFSVQIVAIVLAFWNLTVTEFKLRPYLFHRFTKR